MGSSPRSCAPAASRLATYDYRGLGRLLRARLEDDGRGWRVCAAEIGVCASDLSRICNGQSVSAPKVIAVCDWLKLAVRAFYDPPEKPAADRETDKVFHGKSTETGPSADV
ncbi:MULTISPECIES: hypothetical protein [unclassified Mesorhizobium]|uniref:hypothetical protein n=1 Tax=unclassified Mesorhizobium TaxID=325217 RepID=UPI00112A1E3C|nr:MULTISPECIES: hypothetical protein [unclassified Mesorhizobium]MCA0027360.1 hypothetical protein [Mesorhizobium sp. B263B1A]TPJ98634.1 hypothetical protein FJ489_06820 [Mesorhizobium sp. B2-5-12]TPK28797.1 hypothetical protein FJ562_00210 [Mesorhizobium sp. B2-5-6]